MMTATQYLRQIENYDNRIKNKLIEEEQLSSLSTSVSAIPDTSSVISFELFAISSSCWAVSPASKTPFPTALTDDLINAADSFTACAL